MNFKANTLILPSCPNMMNYQLEIWQKILGIDIKVNERFRNPLRLDKNAGAIIKEKNNYLRLFDSSSEYHTMTVFDIIIKKYNCSFIKACQIAYYDILRGKLVIKSSPIIKEPKKRCKIRTEYRNWDKIDKSFWNGKTEITSKLLESEGTFPVNRFSFTARNGLWLNRTPKYNTYDTKILDKNKIYTPYGRFFLSNMDRNCIGGNKEFEFKIGEPRILLLTKNQKSYLCNINIGYNSRFIIHEGVSLPKHIMDEFNDTFDYIISILDNDLAGILANNKLYKEWVEYIGNDKFIEAHFPIQKETYIDAFNQKKPISDSFDYSKAFSLKRLDQEIKEILFQNL